MTEISPNLRTNTLIDMGIKSNKTPPQTNSNKEVFKISTPAGGKIGSTTVAQIHAEAEFQKLFNETVNIESENLTQPEPTCYRALADVQKNDDNIRRSLESFGNGFKREVVKPAGDIPVTKEIHVPDDNNPFYQLIVSLIVNLSPLLLVFWTVFSMFYLYVFCWDFIVSFVKYSVITLSFLSVMYHCIPFVTHAYTTFNEWLRVKFKFRVLELATRLNVLLTWINQLFIPKLICAKVSDKAKIIAKLRFSKHGSSDLRYSDALWKAGNHNGKLNDLRKPNDTEQTRFNFRVEVKVENNPIIIAELDNGSHLSIISLEYFTNVISKGNYQFVNEPCAQWSGMGSNLVGKTPPVILNFQIGGSLCRGRFNVTDQLVDTDMLIGTNKI